MPPLGVRRNVLGKLKKIMTDILKIPKHVSRASLWNVFHFQLKNQFQEQLSGEY